MSADEYPSKTKMKEFVLWCRWPKNPSAGPRKVAQPQQAKDGGRLFTYQTEQAVQDQIAVYRPAFPDREFGIQEIHTRVSTSEIAWERDVHEPKNPNSNSAAIAAAYTESHDA